MDVIALSRYLVGLIVLDNDQLIRADVNEDGSVTNDDAIMLSGIIIGLSI